MKVWIPLILFFTVFGVHAKDDFSREGKRDFKDTLENKPPPALKVNGWMNTPDGKPINLKDLQGQVILLDFWGVW